MSGRVYLRLTANKEAVKGESSVSTIGGEDVSTLIECDSFTEGCRTAQEAGSMTPTGTRLYDPIVIRKNVDSSSPLIMRALTDTEPCEAEFLFFRPTKASGKQEKFFTITISDARISEVKRFLPEESTANTGGAKDVSAAGKPPQELVSFVFGKISWKHEVGKTEHDDIWQNQ
jgi:type VI secretion system Hcp family effector